MALFASPNRALLPAVFPCVRIRIIRVWGELQAAQMQRLAALPGAGITSRPGGPGSLVSKKNDTGAGKNLAKLPSGEKNS